MRQALSSFHRRRKRRGVSHEPLPSNPRSDRVLFREGYSALLREHLGKRLREGMSCSPRLINLALEFLSHAYLQLDVLDQSLCLLNREYGGQWVRHRGKPLSCLARKH